jgi:peptide deformylase
MVLHPAPVLRGVCPPVEGFDSTLRDLIEERCDLMLTRQGLGLPGPQVAIQRRMLVARSERANCG